MKNIAVPALAVLVLALLSSRTARAQAVNNNFANAIALSGPTVTATGSNVGATKEGSEPNHAGNRGGASVWWTWTAPAGGLTTIDTSGSSFNTLLGVYTGSSLNALTTIAGNDDYNGNTWSRVQFTATAGTVYRIAVDGFRGNAGGAVAATGSIALNLQGPGVVTIVSPGNGTVFTAGDLIPISVTFSTNFPNPPPTKVDFYRGGVLFASSTTLPFSAITTNSPPGSNSFLVRATDSTGQSYPSPVVSVAVLNPGVTILSPPDGASYLNTNPIPISVATLLPEGFFATDIGIYVDGQRLNPAGTNSSVVWTNVTPGVHKLTATEAATDGNSYLSTPVLISVASVLAQSNSVWKYLDNGSNQGTNWITPGFDDSGWASGPAPLGYSDSNGRFPRTTNSYGLDASNKFTTTYYRQSFVVTNAANTNLFLDIQRDDGAVVYLNGVEVGRFNMPTGLITYTTFASTVAADDGGATFTTNINPSLLVSGANVLAVEVHQSDLTSSDLWFVMDLVGVPLIIRNQLPSAQFLAPANGATYFAAPSISLSATALDLDGAVVRVDFYSDNTKIGTATTTSNTFDFVWSNPPAGRHVLQAVPIDDQGAAGSSPAVTIFDLDFSGIPLTQITNPSPGQIFYGPTNLTIGALANGEDTIASVQFRANGTLIGEADAPPFAILWTNATYGTDALTCVASDINGLSATSAVVNVVVLTNDAPLVTLGTPTNGSSFLAATPVPFVATATDGQGVARVDFYSNAAKVGQAFFSPYTFSWTGVAAGSYQLRAVATDYYGLAGTSAVVNITVTNDAPPTISITAPANNAPYNTPANITFNVNAGDIDGTVSKVEFFGAGAKVGENSTSPFSFTWSNVLTTGSVALYAVATDNLGFRGTSGIVNVSITALVTPQWISFNDQNQGPASSPNDTFYTAAIFGTNSGPLKDSYTGAPLPASLTVTNNPGITNAPTMSAPAAGTPAYNTFTGYIDWNSGTGSNVANGFHVFPTNTIGYLFTGLDPRREYNFAGTSVRGGTTPTPGNEYSNRWTRLELAGALSYTPAHSSNVITAARFPNDLTGSQAAFNAGVNNTAATGDVVEWDNIMPAPDGTITVLCTKYNGAFPGGSAANSVYTFALTAIKLAVTPFTFTSQPQSQTIMPGDNATFTVSLIGAPPYFFQWFKNGVKIDGATNVSYSIFGADLPDQGNYSITVSNLTDSPIVSSNATLLVGFYPIVITSQPQPLGVNEGAPVSLTVGFTGALPYHFQWFKDGVPIPGATNQNFSIASATVNDMAPYFVLVSDRFSSDVSSEAAITVFSPSAPATTLLRFGDTWRYDQSGTDFGTAWKDPGYIDAAWASGQGVFAKTALAIPQPINTALALTNGAGLSITSYYFRAHFTWPFPTTNVFLVASNLLDDGAVYYLNGVEVSRLRIAAGPVTYLTAATSAPGNGASYEVLTFPSGALLQGDNLLAVEVHQATNGADAVFGLALKAIAKNSESARITVSPGNQTINENATALFSAEVFGTPPFSFQWYKDGQLLAGATNQNLLVPAVHSPNEGVYSLVAGNRFNSVQSGGARLTVIRDTTPPTIASVVANDLSTVVVVFSEPIDPASALDPDHYLFNPGLDILGMRMLNSMAVLITTSPRDPQFDYSLIVGGVQDLALPPNGITPGAGIAVHRRNNGVNGGLSGVQTVFLIIFENMDWASIKGNTNAPYMNSLLALGSHCEQYHAHSDQHPSEPNYIFLEAGTNFGFTDDSGPSVDRLTSTNHLVTLLNNAGIDWRAYMESMPIGATGTANSGQYVGRHNPFAFFNDVTTDYNYATNHMRPYSYFAGDLGSGNIGRYNWITPNLTNDMHDLAPGSTSAARQGDTWLAQELPQILNSAAFANNGAVFITFDESAAPSLNPIMMVVLSPLAKGDGYTSTNFYDHSSTVRTMQDIFGVRPYLGDAGNATNLSELFYNLKITSSRANGLTSLTMSDLPVGKINYLQASSDMIHWTTLTLVAADGPNETITVSDTSAANQVQRFYRVVEAP